MNLRAALAALLMLLASCGENSTPRPSVVVITIDTLRGDAVGPGADGMSRTPQLDALGARGTRFLHASTVTPLTLPTHASILTGLRPARHGLTVNGVTSPHFESPLLTTSLRDAGYTTAAFVSAAVLERRYGLAESFDVYDDDLLVPGGPWMPTERRGDYTVDRARAWLDTVGDKPFFLWVHLFDPHAPYDAPGSNAGDDVRAAYLDEVEFVDTQVGRLLEQLDGREDVLVVATADHGEGLGEHDEETHGLLLRETTMHVPLVWAWWGAPDAGAPFSTGNDVRNDAASVLDIAPTVLDVLDLPVPPGLDGVSLVTPVSDDRVVPLETRAPWFYYGSSALAGARRGSQKVVAAVDADPIGAVLTDVVSDPREVSPQSVSADHDLALLIASPVPEAEAQAVASREALFQLGYISAEAPTETSGPRRDPRAIVGLLRVLDRANSAIVEGRPEEALELLRELDADASHISEALYLEGRAAAATGKPDEAVEILTEAALRQPGSSGILLELSRAWLLTGDSAAATARLAARTETDLDRAGAYAASRDAAKTMLELVPGDPDAVAQWALAAWSGGDSAAALSRLDEALDGRPTHLGLWTVSLRILASGGPDAADELERARAAVRALAPDHPLLP